MMKYFKHECQIVPNGIMDFRQNLRKGKFGLSFVISTEGGTQMLVRFLSLKYWNDRLKSEFRFCDLETANKECLYRQAYQKQKRLLCVIYAQQSIIAGCLFIVLR